MKLLRQCSLILLALVPMMAQANPYGIVYSKQFLEEEAIRNLFSPTTPAPQSSSQLLYHGGPVLANTKAYAVLWGQKVDPNTKSGIGGMLAAILNSTYWDMLKEYDTTVSSVDGRAGTGQKIGRGTYAGMVTISPSLKKTTVDDTDIGAELERQINNGALAKPDANTVYMIYFPPGVSITLQGSKSCSVFCGYHHNYSSQTQGILYYAVQPDLGGSCAYGCGFGSNKFDDLTTVTSHEITEATTDPAANPGGGEQTDAWHTDDGHEIGDLCASTEARLNLPNGSSYLLQAAYDNASSSCPAGPFQSP